MNIAFHAGVSGLRAHQYGIDVIAHNIANVNTYGFKSDKAEFRDLMYTRMDVNTNYTGERPTGRELLVGHGVKLYSLDLRFDQGSFHTTGQKLDFALAGEGLFAVDRNGRVEYTRNGAFNISVEDDGNYLVAADGAYVLDRNRERMRIIYDENTGEIDSEAIADRLGVFAFDNPWGLHKIDAVSFLPTDISGEPRLAFEIGLNGQLEAKYQVYTNALEHSNTNIAEEMSDLIVSQKAYQFSARVVTTADELEQIVNNLRRGG